MRYLGLTNALGGSTSGGGEISDWTSEKLYNPNELVIASDNFVYRSKVQNQDKNPVENPDIWDLQFSRDNLPKASDEVLGGVKLSTSIIANGDDGSIKVADNSHYHIINNITNLQTSLDNKLETSLKGNPNGLAELNDSGKVVTSQLPSYIDEIIEGYYNTADGKFYKEPTYETEIPGQDGKLYFSLDTNITYRWSGSRFVEISSSLTLGETSSTAYRGDRGKIAYDHSQLADGSNPHGTTFANIVDNIATTEKLGGIKVGEKLSINEDGVLSADDQSYILPPATVDTLGGVKQGNNITIDPDGTISANGGTYELPIATRVTLGGIKVGENLTITQDGILNAISGIYELPIATKDTLGGIKLSDSIVAQSSDGSIRVADNSHQHTINNITDLQISLDNKLDKSLKGEPDGLAELGSNGKVPSTQLPSYIDEIVEGYYNTADGKFYKEPTYETEIPGEDGKIYVSLDNKKTYRWSGTIFVEISASLALGETSSTAYRGDRGKIAYDHSQLTDGSNPHSTTFANIVDNIATTEKLGGIKVGENLVIDQEGKLDAIDTTYEEATIEKAGLMSPQDKRKLNVITEIEYKDGILYIPKSTGIAIKDETIFF